MTLLARRPQLGDGGPVALDGRPCKADIEVRRRSWWPRLAVAVFCTLMAGCGDEDAAGESDMDRPMAGQRLQLLSWNIGYAGLGSGSDFFKDLGSSIRPPSPEAVDANLSGIRTAMASIDADLFLFQEMARPSYVTYRRDVLSRLKEDLPNHAANFVPDFRTHFVPRPFSLRIGNASFVRPEAEIERIVLDGHTERYAAGLASRVYTVHRIRLDGTVPWTIFNLHLSAFDESDSGKRETQAQEVIALAEAEWLAGRCVVVGGDWNMRLVPTDFPHDTDPRFQFWIRDLVPDLLPEGWRWIVDRTAPTVRTLHKPFVAGENYVTIVDGWAVSPNVRVEDVKTHDLGFAHSDHNPIYLRVGCAS